jgi:hypothetical protein
MNGLMKWLLSLLAVSILIRYRYKVLNTLLGSYWLRKWAISLAMNIPGIRSKFIQSTFR